MVMTSKSHFSLNILHFKISSSITILFVIDRIHSKYDILLPRKIYSNLVSAGVLQGLLLKKKV